MEFLSNYLYLVLIIAGTLFIVLSPIVSFKNIHVLKDELRTTSNRKQNIGIIVELLMAMVVLCVAVLTVKSNLDLNNLGLKLTLIVAAVFLLLIGSSRSDN